MKTEWISVLAGNVGGEIGGEADARAGGGSGSRGTGSGESAGGEASGIADGISRAADVIRAGGLVAFPTETVYGLGADGLNEQAARKIYEAKGRPSDNPLILHIARWGQITALVGKIPEAGKALAERFWPGPLTLIFPKADIVPYGTTGGLGTVAVRMPDHPVAQAFLRKAGVPVAAPSANLSGRPSPTTAEHVREDLDGRIDVILDGGPVGIGLESTIVDVSGRIPTLLRPGFISLEELRAVIGQIMVDPAVLAVKPDPALRPKAPGMKYRHYAPKAEMTLYEGEARRVVERINREVAIARKEGLRAAVLATDETRECYRADLVLSVGSREKLESVAHNLFYVLREFDEAGVDRIFAESFGTGQLGLAIMNRMLKAAGYRRIEV